MNTDDRLRRAADEMDRVTASVTAPPIGEVHRSARMRNVGVALAAAVGVMVLIAAAVVGLAPRGENTLEPASPGETTIAGITSTTAAIPQGQLEVDGIPILIPAAPSAIDFIPDGEEARWVFPAAGEIEAGARRALGLVQEVGDATGIVALGVHGPNRAYLVTGTGCMVTLADDGWGRSCGFDSLKRTIDDVALGVVITVLGEAPPDAAVLAIDVAGDVTWTRVREGYVALHVTAPEDTSVSYVVYNAQGDLLERVAVQSNEPGPVETTIAVAVEDDGSCSGADHYPAEYESAGLPEPVYQTVAKIALFGSRCWFDDLEAVAGDQFTASFGGDDPSELWAFEEENGYEPMRWLMQILDLDHGTIETENGTLYVWPAAHAHQGDWEDMPAEDLDALRTLFTEEDLQGFADFGGYIGYRVGIWEDGTWSFFVAGD